MQHGTNSDISPISIRGINVYPFVSPDSLIDFIDKRKGILVAINADKVVWATDRTRDIINSNVGYCDGAGAVLALKRKGASGIARIPGCELWLHIIRKYYQTRTFYVIGARKDINLETVQKLRAEFPGIRILGHRDGYINTDDERRALIDDVAAKKPDIVFVAMGSPKQEILMADMMERHKAIYQGLGGSFDVYSGHQSRAPQWMGNMNMEFLYRLIIRPKRIKHDIHKLRFAWWVLSGKI